LIGNRLQKQIEKYTYTERGTYIGKTTRVQSLQLTTASNPTYAHTSRCCANLCNQNELPLPVRPECNARCSATI